MKVIPATKSDVFSLANAWMAQAEHDLSTAQKLHSVGGCFDWACYCAQQAAEKALKSVRICSGTSQDDLKNANGHDLKKLLGTLNVLRGESALIHIGMLTKYEEIARYPGPNNPAPPCKWVDAPMAKEALRMAGDVVKYCKELKSTLETFWYRR